MSRSKRTNITRSIADKFSQKLEGLPEKKKAELTPRELIFENAHKLDRLLGKGYSYDDLLSILKGEGIKLSKSTFRQYLREGLKCWNQQDESVEYREQHLSERTPIKQDNGLAEKLDDVDDVLEPSPRKFRKGRLQSDENAAARYPGNTGIPLEIKSDL